MSPWIHVIWEVTRRRVLLPHHMHQRKSHAWHTTLSSEKGNKSYHLILGGVIVKDLHRWREGSVWLFIWLIFTPTFLALLEQKKSISHYFIQLKIPIDLQFYQKQHVRYCLSQGTPIFRLVSSSVQWVYLLISNDSKDQMREHTHTIYLID